MPPPAPTPHFYINLLFSDLSSLFSKNFCTPSCDSIFGRSYPSFNKGGGVQLCLWIFLVVWHCKTPLPPPTPSTTSYCIGSYVSNISQSTTNTIWV